MDNYYMEVPEGLDEGDLAEDPNQWGPAISDVLMDMAPYWALEGNIPALIDRLDILFAYGSMSSATRQIITTAANQYYEMDPEGWEEVVRLTLLLTVTSADVAILK